METITTLHGYRYAVSMAGSVMGRGADLIIGDDPMSSAFALSEAVRKTEVNLWMTAHRTRLNNKREGAIVLVMQRLHQNDLVGHVLGSEDWEVLSIPAIATDPAAYRIGPDSEDVYNRQLNEVLHPEREPLGVLEATRRAIGSLTFSAQYQQDPVPPGGDVIRRDWLRFYDEAPAEFERLIVSWDTASTLSETSDWSVGTVWGAIGDEFYLLDVVRERLETPELRRTILRISEQWEADATLIEDTELGRALAQDLRASRRLRPLLERPRFDKQARLLAQAARFEAGQVLLPREAPWLGVYVGEILAFPTGSHDDQVDSTSQALRWLTARQAHPVDRPTREVERRDIRRVNFVTRRTRRDER
jgi:predicted phage terminase large subunit-like protein